MGIQVYALTPLGRAMARSVKNPPTPPYRIIHHLDKVGHATRDQLESMLGISTAEAAVALVKLRHKGIIVDETNVEV